MKFQRNYTNHLLGQTVLGVVYGSAEQRFGKNGKGIFSVSHKTVISTSAPSVEREFNAKHVVKRDMIARSKTGQFGNAKLFTVHQCYMRLF